MARPDRRESSQIRALNCVLGPLNRVDGSAQFTSGNTSLICGIYGPIDVKVFDEKLDRAHLEVKFRPDINVSTTKDRWIESAIRNTFERNILGHLHPRTLVQINLQVREGDGSVDAVAINATTMALVDAGVPLRCMVAAATCAVMPGGEMVVDPVAEEVELAVSVHTMAFAEGAPGGEPVYVDSRGDFSMEQYSKCHDICAMTAERILAFMRTAIEGKVAKESHISAI
ncbi:ribosomal protein S5 domain 2-type protein [Kickxella alabastrina]|uniref:ribosomal protein S5 domain 2-type protein n=1 Tax=Kickxella alabastrina TaxID=61397 RepID=UPI002220A5A0|nr:ribosomal protein S5 domain 2-type protein [Kickxella alabastrina]KAI7833806.1 ribosomal protein S5 domain 2-type protein [Kickxella alabastrina]KAJ1936782.1 exosome non-catalytic core subunit rrp46 [Kickxella alabastrina]